MKKLIGIFAAIFIFSSTLNAGIRPRLSSDLDQVGSSGGGSVMDNPASEDLDMNGFDIFDVEELRTTGTAERYSGTNAFVDLNDGGAGKVTRGGLAGVNNESETDNFESSANKVTTTSTTGVLNHEYSGISLGTTLDLIAGSEIQLGSTTAASASCVGVSSDRPFADLDCGDSKGTGEKYLDLGLMPTQTTYQNASIINGILSPVFLFGWQDTPGTTATDLSGNGRDATYAGSMDSTDQLTFKEVYLLDFDGTDDHLTIADADTYSFGNGITDSAFSVCALIQGANSATGKRIITKWDPTGGAELREWTFSLASNEELQLGVYDESANASEIRVSSSTFTSPTTYYFVCGTYSGVGGTGASGGMVLYSNGVALSASSSDSGTYVAMENLSTNVMIGGMYTSGTVAQPWISDMGYVMIFSTELTAVEIKKLYNSIRWSYDQ